MKNYTENMYEDIYTCYLNSIKFDKLKSDIVKWIKGWFYRNGKRCKAVIGISGGKDSTIAAALCVEALGKENVVGVLLPQGEQSDINDSYEVVKNLQIPFININIADINSSIIAGLADKIDISEQTKINIPPRIRMTLLYAVAQSVNGRVVNTCNLSENWVGYSTWYGDSAGDFSPFAHLTTDEVIAVGKLCGLPTHLIEKTPSDGLCGKSDEDNLGFTYHQLNMYIRTGKCADRAIKKLIDEKHKKNLFKVSPIECYNPFQIVGANTRL